MNSKIKSIFIEFLGSFHKLLKSRKPIIFSSTLYLVALPTSMALMEILGYPWAFFSLIYLFLNREEIDFKLNIKEFLKSPELPIVLYIIWGAFVTVSSSHITENLLHHLGPLRLFTIYLVARFTFRSQKELTFGLKLLIFVSSLGFIQAILQNYFRYDFIKGVKYHYFYTRMSVRAQGFFNSSLTFSNAYIMFFLLGLMAALFLWKNSKVKERVFLVIFTGIGTLGLFYSGCRFLIYAFPFCVSLLFFLRNYKWGAICTLFFILFFGGVYLSSKSIQKKFSTISSLELKSNKTRLRLFSAYYEIFKDYPIKGVGINNEKTVQGYLKKLYPDGQYRSGHAHNHFLHVLGTTGIFGFLFFILFNTIWFLNFCSSYYKSKDLRAKGIFAFGIVCFLAFHISGLTQNTYGDSEVAHSFFYFMGTLMMISKNSLLRSELKGKA